MKNKAWVALMVWSLIPASLKAEDRPLRVAVLPFESNTQKETPQLRDFIKQAISQGQEASSTQLTLGEKITELFTNGLSGNPAIQLVERAKIDKAFEELALGKTGIVDDAAAARVGHVVGAQVLITGKAFPLDDALYIVAKVVGVETSRVFAAKQNGPLTGKLAPMVGELADETSKILLKYGNDLIGKDAARKDYEALIVKALGKEKRPVVALAINERHMKQESVNSTVDTEVSYLLNKSGFEVVDEKNRRLSDWAKSYMDDTRTSLPHDLKAEVLIVGEAVSEFAARRGELISCKARVELRALDARSGKVLAIERKTATAVDIAENMAAKSALKDAADEIALTLLPAAATNWSKK